MHPLLPLELEGLGHDRDRQCAQLSGQLTDDRRRARTRSATQPGGDEHQVGSAQYLNDLVLVLLDRLAADLGAGPGAQTAGQLLADLHLDRRATGSQHLAIRVDRDELDAGKILLDHPVDGVVAAAAHADDLDDGAGRELLRLGAALAGFSRLAARRRGRRRLFDVVDGEHQAAAAACCLGRLAHGVPPGLLRKEVKTFLRTRSMHAGSRGSVLPAS